ncbi:hypothetical protein AVEN_255248-1 [Araneus ventricosus]|uniref:Uncharacterized protein n=1 Tax=Araneus ventricosus TaxID=182803 RepID=A0A4Y2BCU9_ARAVE|nr:hypothetical protein AVEN_255248-1 [Araneus ventricosus]
MKLNSIQRKFLLNISGAYSTTPTVALQVIEEIISLHIKAKQEAAYARTDRLRKTCNYNNINFNPNNYEDGTTSTKFHPSIFQLEDRISLKKQFLQCHGPFPTYLKQYNIRNDSCGCGNLGNPFHCATSCLCTMHIYGSYYGLD